MMNTGGVFVVNIIMTLEESSRVVDIFGKRDGQLGKPLPIDMIRRKGISQ